MELSEQSAGSVSNEELMVDLKTLCRMCARICVDNPDLNLISFSTDGPMIDKMKVYLKIKVHMDPDLMPKQICQECHYALEQWTETVAVVKKAGDFFLKQLQTRGTSALVKVEPDIDLEEDGSYECDKCSEEFSDSENLAIHQLEHHSVQNTSVKRKRKAKRQRTKRLALSDYSDDCEDNVEADQDFQPLVSTTSSSKRSCSTRNCFVTGRSFQCSVCNHTFPKAEEFFDHLINHSPTQEIGCSFCKCKFNLVEQLIEHTLEHIKHESKQVQTFPCLQCPSGPFATESALQNHLDMVHPPPAPQPTAPFPCGLCSLGFDEFVDYSKHVQTHINFRHFPCALCGCRFTKVPYLLEHVKQHANGNNRQITFMCEICPDQVFSSKHNLASHMTKKHRINSAKSRVNKATSSFEPGFFSFPSNGQQSGVLLQCGLCEREVNSCQALADHIDADHKKFKHLQCKKCHCKFTKLPYYFEHMSEHFANPDKILAIPCEACEEIFSSKHNLSKHIYKKHRNTYTKLSAQKQNQEEQAVALNAPEDEVRFQIERDPKTKLFHCKNCPQTFKNATLLNTHLLIHVPNKCPTCHGLFETREQLKEHLTRKCSLEEKFPCPICGKLLASKQSMRIHTSLHSSERKFVCEVCAKSYRTQSALVSHRNVVHLQKSQFMCHICARTFSFKLAMKRHVMLHMGDLPHKCAVCSKAFVTSNLLKIHVAKEHERRISHYCTSCKKGFVDIIGLRRHMRMVCKVPEYAIPYIRDRQFVKHSV